MISVSERSLNKGKSNTLKITLSVEYDRHCPFLPYFYIIFKNANTSNVMWGLVVNYYSFFLYMVK